MKFSYRVMPQWPEFAWLAECVPGAQEVIVRCGNGVERYDEWFCEAAWPGEFEAGDFDQTDVIGGSGARLRGGSVIFVSASSTTDRLHRMARAGRDYISNSLVCLVASQGLTIDKTYPKYVEDFASIVKGINDYRKWFRTNEAEIELVYFRNVSWDGQRTQVTEKPQMARDFGSFESYFAFLSDTMKGIAANAASTKRSSPLALLGTISTGYDSPTVCALAAEAGCTQALCFDKTHKDEDDSGHHIAAILGLKSKVVAGAAWRQSVDPEVAFIASNAMGEEVRFKGAESMLRHKVLLTGYHGDKIWDIQLKHLGPDIVRGDPSGLALTEYRLWAGFLHSPVPFWGCTQLADIYRISNSPELTKWNTSGGYSRPICRRILEERGVPRDYFGATKRMASVMRHNDPNMLTPASANDYQRWLRQHRQDWWRKYKLPPLGTEASDRFLCLAKSRLSDSVRDRTLMWRLDRWFRQPNYWRRFAFAWAIERALQRYTPID